jgi:hypothetical protein
MGMNMMDMSSGCGPLMTVVMGLGSLLTLALGVSLIALIWVVIGHLRRPTVAA